MSENMPHNMRCNRCSKTWFKRKQRNPEEYKRFCPRCWSENVEAISEEEIVAKIRGEMKE